MDVPIVMTTKDFVYKTVEGLDVAATVYWPQTGLDNRNTKLPIAIGFHAGGFTIGSRFLFNPEEVKLLLDLGFVVVLADYRLCPHVTLYDGPIQDARDAFRWTKTTLPDLIRNEVGITLDPSRVVAFGQSSGGTLALHLGSLTDPPKAIAAFYAAAYFSDDTWSQPTPGSEMMPPIDQSLAQRVFSEPPRSMTVISPEQFIVPGTMPMPDLSRPRDAWMALAFKEGKHLERCVHDGDLARVDPATFFSSAFPPTILLTGTKDTFIDPRFSRRAHEHLTGLGVETKLILAEGGQHGFDFGLGRDEAQFKESVLPGYEFLAEHV
ncbi:alpha/beta hydrolase [Aspergillus udagawae]|uniref:Alpha/beta hydrolase fold-3 domain-containing protein n=1 Tax=Aspergillus udagawae TaxID=91492 RepID=A0A8E0R282_9EURO|nr:uncharacterized protein Aud_010137 [Aspergillus udagawae]GIC93649.1 hypothetical protein Aud_010137 [Aspergillus udagawae]